MKAHNNNILDRGQIVFAKNKIYNADCFDLIEVMPNESLDLVIVDPPYGDGIGYGKNGKEILNNEDESINYRFLDAVLPKMKHVQHTETSHPHQKEYDIIRKIILHSSNEGDLVFDGFMGSFSTAIACHKENRNYIGAELDSKWYGNGLKALQALEAQHTLF